MNQNLPTHDLVEVVIGGETVTTGRAEYRTADGWVGVRQDGGRLDEFPEAAIRVL